MNSVKRIHLQPAYVMHQRPFRDSSAIVDVFTEAYGRQSVVAKGIKQPKSRLRGLLQPFQPLLLSWVGKSDLGTLTGAEFFSRPAAIKAKYVPSAFYLNELIQYLLQRDDPHEELFACYHQTLEQLQQLTGQHNEEWLCQAYLRRFEVVLLQAIGYGLVLDHDVNGNLPIDGETRYEYVIDHGPVKADVYHEENLESRAVNIGGRTLLMLANENQLLARSRQVDTEAGNKELFREAKRLLRTIIDYHLGHKTLHSRVLFAKSTAREETFQGG